MAKVLIIDDDRKHSELLQTYFKRFGINLVCALEAEEGFRKLNREDPDLVLLDVMLPGKDGFEILRDMRGAGDDTPVLILSARISDSDRIRGLELDGAAHGFYRRVQVAEVALDLRQLHERDSHPRTAADELAAASRRAPQIPSFVEAGDLAHSLVQLDQTLGVVRLGVGLGDRRRPAADVAEGA